VSNNKIIQLFGSARGDETNEDTRVVVEFYFLKQWMTFC